MHPPQENVYVDKTCQAIKETVKKVTTTAK